MNYILITGGAGYIGRHLSALLQQHSYTPVILDTQPSNGIQRGAIYIQGDIQDITCLRNIFSQYNIKAVVHLAALLNVKESTIYPDLYYQNNITGTLQLIKSMLEANIPYLVFSSSCAIYGDTSGGALSENAEIIPTSPYGYSKKVIDEILKEYDQKHGIRSATLRLFNVAGVYTTGEDTAKSTHIIPRAIASLLSGKQLTVFGKDYPTADGTCIRDYVHVSDVANACLLSMQALIKKQKSFTCNIGSGQGYSILDILHTTEQLLQKAVPYRFERRRAGDPAQVVADISCARTVLGWEPTHNLEDIIVSEHEWQKFLR